MTPRFRYVLLYLHRHLSFHLYKILWITSDQNQ